MKLNTKTFLSALALLSTINHGLSASPLGTAFTYQGKLSSGANAANGVYDFNFALFNAVSGGAQQGAGFSTNAVPVANGLFTVTLDFGASFLTGEARFLEIGVRTNGSGTFRTLPVRQPLMPAPQALWAQNAGTAAAGAVSANSLNTPGSPVPGQILTYNGSQLAWMSLSGTGPAWGLTGNSGTAAGASFLGTTDNQALELKVNAQRALRLEPTTNGAPNLLVGTRATRSVREPMARR